MATYKEAGVDIAMGDKCSQIAYGYAKKTFPGRKGMIGEPITMDNGFTGALDMGDFYLVQNDDGVGSKMVVAEALYKYDTLGYDLLAMVTDDAACVGAEVIAMTNTIDVNKVDEKVIESLMKGLSKAALEQHVVIPGGEIAELGDMVNGYTWNASATGIVKKNKFIDGKGIKEGDRIVGLRSKMFRSNGFTLVRHILREKFGQDWVHAKYDEKSSWGEVVLTPSIIYHGVIMKMHGRFNEEPKVGLKGVVHITGGGIPGNLKRLVEGAVLDNLPPPHEPMLRLKEMGKVSDEEAYRTWNMGVGMIIIPDDPEKAIEIAKQNGVSAQIIGRVEGRSIQIKNT